MSGMYSEQQLLSYYGQMRRSAMRQVERIAKSEAGFYGDRPYFLKESSLITTLDILHAIADVNRFRGSKGYSLTARREALSGAISRLKDQGFEVSRANIKKFGEFMTWFKASAYAALFDSDAEEVTDVFNASDGKGGSRKWNKLFREYAGE